MNWNSNLSAAENHAIIVMEANYELKVALKEILDSPVIRSDKDNMEFDYRLSCFTIEKARKVLGDTTYINKMEQI